MIEVRIFDPSAIAPEDFDVYVRAYESPGAMRAGFELYRAFDEDAAMIRDAIRGGGKLELPVLAVGGANGGLGPILREMLSELAECVETAIAPRSAHWIPEENPGFLVDAITKLRASA
jgi:pimeloyl-ACP methyl ester carboxylesterase